MPRWTPPLEKEAMTIAEAQAQLWEASKRLPVAQCPICFGEGGIPWPDRIEPCTACDAKGEAPSDLAKACEMAVTEECGACLLYINDATYNWEPCADHDASIGRVLRPVPGEKTCKRCNGRGSRDPHHPLNKCEDCLGSGTVPGTDEASVVARWEGCGRLGPVSKALWDTDPGPAGDDAFVHLCQKLEEGDYLGALQAATAAVEAVIAHEPTTHKTFTKREAQVAALLSRGYTNGAIAASLDRSLKTVEHRLNGIYSKLMIPDYMNPRVYAALHFQEKS